MSEEAVFTVIAPTGTWTASASELEHAAGIVHRRGGGAVTRQEARWLAFEELVSIAWDEAEAAERGLEVPSEVVDRELAAEIRRTFRGRRRFERFLRDTGETVDDIKRRMRMHLLTEMIREQIKASVTDARGEQAELERFASEFGRKWKSRTICAPEFQASRKCAERE
jgi:hypothetical protein